jgi:hypothetical protein
MPSAALDDARVDGVETCGDHEARDCARPDPAPSRQLSLEGVDHLRLVEIAVASWKGAKSQTI